MATAITDAARAEKFEQYLKQMAKERPGEVLLLSDETSGVSVEAIPTGAISLDVALGCGGFPRGRVIELFGPYGSGKSSLALSVAAQCQKMGGEVAFVDAEHALNRQLALDMGVDPTKMVIVQPSFGEDAIEFVEGMVSSGGFAIVIVDSVAAMVPKAEVDADVGSQQMGLHARLMSKFMRRIAGPCAETNTMLILINQVRTNLGAYGAPEVSTGGSAIKFYSSVRIEVRSANSKKIERNKVVVGQTCVATVKKNKAGPPHRTAEYDLIFGEGIESGGALLEVCEKLGIITRAGSSYTDATTGERIAVGKEATKMAISADEAMTERLTASVYAVLRGDDAGILAPATDAAPIGGVADDDGDGSDVDDATDQDDDRSLELAG